MDTTKMLERVMKHTIHPTDLFFNYVMEAPECDELKLNITTDMTPVLSKDENCEECYIVPGVTIIITSHGKEVVNVNDGCFSFAVAKGITALNNCYMTSVDLIETIEDDGLTYYDK